MTISSERFAARPVKFWIPWRMPRGIPVCHSAATPKPSQMTGRGEWRWRNWAVGTASTKPATTITTVGMMVTCVERTIR